MISRYSFLLSLILHFLTIAVVLLLGSHKISEDEEDKIYVDITNARLAEIPADSRPKAPTAKLINAAKNVKSASPSPSARAESETGIGKPTADTNTQAQGDAEEGSPEYLLTQMPKPKKEVRVPYPPEAKRLGIEGVVILKILIDENGKVKKAKVIEGPGHGLNEAAASAMLLHEFSPAKINDKATAVSITYKYNFILD